MNNINSLDRKQIKDWPGYSICKNGDVISSRFSIDKILKTGIDRSGYLSVTLSKKNHTKKRRIHVMMAETFIGVRPIGMQIRHLDGNKFNNNIDNLKYGTAKENGQDQVRLGKTPIGGTKNNSKLSPHHVRIIRKMYSDGLKKYEIHSCFKMISYSTISDIINKKSWGWL
jgi:hypothetical protein